MKKLLLVLTIAMLSTICYGQEKTDSIIVYSIVNITGQSNTTRLAVTPQVKAWQDYERVTNEKGEKILFRTPAAVLNYFISKGWKLEQLHMNLLNEAFLISKKIPIQDDE